MMITKMMYKGMTRSFHADMERLKKEDGDMEKWIRR